MIIALHKSCGVVEIGSLYKTHAKYIKEPKKLRCFMGEWEDLPIVEEVLTNPYMPVSPKYEVIQEVIQKYNEQGGMPDGELSYSFY